MTNKLPIEALGCRLEELKGELSVSEFARLCQIPDSSMRAYLEGCKPGIDVIVRIADANLVSVDWLVLGVGERALDESRMSAHTSPADRAGICDACGHTFVLKRPWQRFCSTQCRKNHHSVKAAAIGIPGRIKRISKLRGESVLMTLVFDKDCGALAMHVGHHVYVVSPPPEAETKRNPFGEIRRLRLHELLLESGTQRDLARRINRHRSQVCDLLSGKRTLGRFLAREIEAITGKPSGWLDTVAGSTQS